jgi:hypothetical protein
LAFASAYRHPFEDPWSRLAWLRLVLCTGLAAGLALSISLWLPGRDYPLAPVAGLLPEVSALEVVLLAGIAALLVLALTSSGPGPWLLGLVVLLAIEVALDQTRLQPWVYQYGFMLAALGLFSWRRDDLEGQRTAVRICCLIVAGIYIWSGLQKANASFMDGVFPWLIEPFTSALSPGDAARVADFGFMVPILETSIGVGLLTRRFRDYAVIGAMMMHGFILLSIGPTGHDFNSVVWPWNLTMVALVFLLFWRSSPDAEQADAERRVGAPLGRFGLAAAILFLIMPALSFLHLWDSYLSGSLYSGNTLVGALFLNGTPPEALPPKSRRYIESDTSVGPGVDFADWSYGELNVPPYPERRVFKRITGDLCQEPAARSGLQLAIYEYPSLFSRSRDRTIYGCDSL